MWAGDSSDQQAPPRHGPEAVTCPRKRTGRHHTGLLPILFLDFPCFVLFSAENMLVTCLCWETPRCATENTDPKCPPHQGPSQTCWSQDRLHSASQTRHWPLAFQQCSPLLGQMVLQGPRLVRTEECHSQHGRREQQCLCWGGWQGPGPAVGPRALRLTLPVGAKILQVLLVQQCGG